jgi:PmbA protein
LQTNEQLLTTAGATALDAARKKAVEAEVFLLYNRELSIELRDERVETLKEAEEIGMGVRVLNQGRMGFAYSSDLSREAILEVVDNAVSISNCMTADEYQSLVEPSTSYPQLSCFDQQIVDTPLEEKIALARASEKAARQFDNRINLVEKSAYEDSQSFTMIMNSKGLNVSFRENLAGIYIALVAREEEDSQTGFAVMARRKIINLDPEECGREAATRAVRSLKAKSIASQQLPCIMEPYVATRFMGLLLPSLFGDAVLKGKSLWAGKMGEPVASPILTLIDDGILPGGLASAPFDGEGTPTRKNELIRKGLLQSYLYDNYSACKAGVQSTGNGRRGSFRSLPAIGSSNLIISPGTMTPEQMIAELDSGLLITEVMGMHTANPISGDFSLGACGILIEAGQLTRPVRGITIAGNLHQLLQNIEALGSDLRFYGAKAAPSIRFKQLSIGGE